MLRVVGGGINMLEKVMIIVSLRNMYVAKRLRQVSGMVLTRGDPLENL
jgi:hypothetical protein